MISLEVQEQLGAKVVERIANETDANRVKISEGMSVEVRRFIVAKFTELGETRHDTADRLGGEQTGFIRDLAQNFDQASTVTVDDDGVSISMRHPIISRAFHDVTIVPTHSQFLTIPVDGKAYGHRAGEFAGLILIRSQTTGNLFLAERPENKGDHPNALFLLVKSVEQKQDRSLFPSDDEINASAALGATRALKAIIAGSPSAT